MRQFFGLIPRVVKRFYQDRCQLTAAELSFVTALALVPSLAVIFPILAAFPVFKEVSHQLLDFALRSFVPEASQQLAEQAVEVADTAAQLSPLGVIFLVVTVLLTMTRVELALNAIWGVHRARRLTSRLPLYWTVLTVGPLLLAVGVLTSSYAASIPFLRATIGYEGLASWWMSLLPILASGVVFFLLYWLVPNRRVPWLAAAVAAAVAAVLFQVALAGFTFYFRIVPTYRALYGAVAAIPVFLVWVYISWNVTLLGAELSFCLAVTTRERALRTAPGIRFLHALTLLQLLHESQREGQPLRLEVLDDRSGQLPFEHRGEVLTTLEDEGLVARTADGDFIATRNLDGLTLSDIWAIVGGPLPDPADPWVGAIPAGPRLADVLSRCRESAREPLEIPLSAFGNEPSQA